MPLSGEYEPSPEAWVRDQVAEYEASGGTRATTLRGVPVIVMTTQGRRSGKLRKVPLMRVEHEGSYAAVASTGGGPKNPAWYANLVGTPSVELQDGPDKRDYVAREVEGEEKRRWWSRAVAVWPDYDAYQAKTEREIPLFVLDPVEPRG